jgi:indolepyruvate ferredoxin oxidoreductase
MSCLRGFCPSFVTLPGAVPRRAAPREIDADPARGLPLPEPAALDAPYGILVTGVGGTGVLTIGALLGMAAHLEGKGVTTLDFTGLAQKNGAVMSHVRIARSPDELHSVRLAPGGADLLLACDLVTAGSEGALSRLERGRTRAVLNTDVAPTAAFLIDGSGVADAPLLAALQAACDPGDLHPIAASRLATALTGDAIATNLLMLGCAFQRGLLPLSLAAIESAIELNGVAVEQSRRVFAWGRVAAHDPDRLASLTSPASLGVSRPPASQATLEAFIEQRVHDLVAYQDARYAQRYRSLVARVAEAEAQRAPGCSGLAEAAAKGLFKLMAYKDEYEVARLYRAPAFRAQLASLFAGDPETMPIEFHLAPPWLTRPAADGSPPSKRRFGRWVWHAFGVVAALKRLRGTPLDPFGRNEDRRLERALRDQHEQLLDEITRTLNPANHALAVELARLPDRIRGFGHVKRANAEAVRHDEGELLARYRAAGPSARRVIPVIAQKEPA